MAGEQLARSSQIVSQQAAQGNRMLFEGMASAPARALEAMQTVHAMKLQNVAIDIKRQQLAEEHMAYQAELQTRQTRAQTALMEQEVAKGKLVIDRFEAETRRASGERADKIRANVPEFAGLAFPDGKGGWMTKVPDVGGGLRDMPIDPKHWPEAEKAWKEGFGRGKAHQPIKEEDPSLGLGRLADIVNAMPAKTDEEKAAKAEALRELQGMAVEEIRRRRRKGTPAETGGGFWEKAQDPLRGVREGLGKAAAQERVPPDVQQAGVTQEGWARARAAGKTPEQIRAYLESRGDLKPVGPLR